jgi:glycosidase
LLEQFIVKKRFFFPRWLLDWKLNRHFARYGEHFFLPLFLDNHDMDRFLFKCGNDPEKLKAAVRIQFAFPQPVVIYYGTEVGMTQEASMWDSPAHGDLQARQPMKWDDQDGELFMFYKKIIAEKSASIGD